MTETKIPRATAKRLPLYYRYLNILHDGGKDRVSSNELAEAIHVDSATIRRDFSYFGALGKRGYGYDVDDLIEFFKNILHQDRLTNVALIGVGNLGHALLNFNFHQDSNIRISAAFDTNPKNINTIQGGVPIYPMDQIVAQLKEQQISVVILTVPSNVAQEVANQVAQAGVNGILNFTSIRLNVPAGIRVHNVDLTNELQTLIYFIDHYDKKSDEDE
ncbi:redox-sensing transcriptional repressor Rex [Fructilactobacillus sanfranciscensis]|uniref:Redox-sensing transcriptional repressor Rex n=1 Tax=Fructilactobacillus sanfranciscensis (strain TMW 1.1304) TaxID=714313 RepID=G2KV50_FRUST|nr:redox-sensing transcriptional repressor Rex [Fructilactobacillus sanfranciscensis]AEN98939.1 Redox-sensing transcriptional repressor rex [Fructilactobacillus sanfranciscensis TMW 1.1304]MCG7194239.1 redox-sensing transcriptional repressor Rex [Fructilactobacillus sanfranciscensis]MCG7195822.1 redox-sensing transcriptional repressor Rex [Fructilactobacillus sanfranciscensis]NDR75851.1 redox-sensing transcriptional repressor Rex [Fructilactobacillus sanfranciscensis]NDR96463.1 redox-sensing t